VQKRSASSNEGGVEGSAGGTLRIMTQPAAWCPASRNDPD
jgi:hypothetical protein